MSKTHAPDCDFPKTDQALCTCGFFTEPIKVKDLKTVVPRFKKLTTRPYKASYGFSSTPYMDIKFARDCICYANIYADDPTMPYCPSCGGRNPAFAQLKNGEWPVLAEDKVKRHVEAAFYTGMAYQSKEISDEEKDKQLRIDIDALNSLIRAMGKEYGS